MTNITQRCVLFADLRGSTGLFEQLGNTQATHVVTSSIASLCETVEECGGTVIKTLGDGLMASFAEAAPAVRAALSMHAALDLPEVQAGDQAAGLVGLRPALKLQIALAWGEVVEMSQDCFGDAVNVAARLLDHAGDDEILVTADVVMALTELNRRRFRSLDRIALRGRAEAVHVFLMNPSQSHDFAATTFESVKRADGPQGLRLSWMGHEQIFATTRMPVTFGRSPQATLRLDDSRISRLHARIDCQGGTLQLSDMSYNGSFICFDHDPATVSLRRSRCTLHGSGAIGLGAPPTDPLAHCIRFEVLRQLEAYPQRVAASGLKPAGAVLEG